MINYWLFICSFFSLNLIADALPVLSESMDKKDWQHFAQVGCGYYPIPEELKSYLASTVDLARSLNASCMNQPGYVCQANQQAELLLLEKEDWNHYPPKTVALAEGMHEIAVSVLLHVLHALDIPPELYYTITGGLTDFEGINFFKIARYDATKNFPGFPWHKDVRWITVLFINQEGLQGKVKGQVIDVHPREGYFIINLGVFFEAFINDPDTLKAFEHHVQQVYTDRVSFGIFCSGDYPSQGFYQLNGDDVCWKHRQELIAFLPDNKKTKKT